MFHKKCFYFCPVNMVVIFRANDVCLFYFPITILKEKNAEEQLDVNDLNIYFYFNDSEMLPKL